MHRMLLLILVIMSSASLALAQAPGLVHVLLPNGNSFVESTNTSGTLSSGGITCT